GSRNGTFINGKRITGDTPLQDGDVINFGANGPGLEFHTVEGESSGDLLATTAAEGMAVRASTPRDVIRASAPRPPRSSTAVRIAVEVARQTAQLRRTTKVLFGLLLITAGAFGWLQWQAAKREEAAQQVSTQFESQLKGVHEALAESRAETARLRRELQGSGGDAASVARLRTRLDDAERRQRALGGVDYRAISHKNQDAVAMVLVEFSDTERFSGTAFSVDSN